MTDSLHGHDAQRACLLDLYHSALTAVQGDRCVARELQRRPLGGRVWGVAIGKAAAAMLAGAHSVLAERLEHALLITKHGHAAGPWPADWEIIEAGHPLPDAASLRAGERLLACLTGAPADVEWLFLLSGGASSLVEVLPEAMTLDELQRVNAWLLASGWPIGRMNAVRRRLSRIKGGRLLDHLGGRPARALLISDVPGDDPAVIGSGLLAASGDVMPIDDRGLPDWLQARLAAADRAAARASSHRPAVTSAVVASLDQALDAAAARAAALGYAVHRATARLDGDAAAAGRRIADQLQAGAPGVYVWGGETTVQLPERPGQGGRCQQLALVAAERLAGNSSVALLAAGSDGSDGPGDAAGACVDGATAQRGRDYGFDVRDSLARADAGRFLEATGDLIDTGPTGTNVTDLVIGVKH